MPNRIIDVYWEIIAVEFNWLYALEWVSGWLALGAYLGWLLASIVKGG